MEDKWISYLRVSTGKQGKPGLGIEAQRAAVADFLNGGPWKLVKEYVEVESGKSALRPKLAEAISTCKAYGAKLVIAKLDRLSRDAHFLLGLEKAGIDFVAADMPNANRLTVGILAVVAEEERRMISARTKAALAAARRRGAKLGGDRGVVPSKKTRALAIKAVQERADAKAANVAPIIAELKAGGKTSLRASAARLNDQGIPTARGTGEWSASQVARVLERIPRAVAAERLLKRNARRFSAEMPMLLSGSSSHHSSSWLSSRAGKQSPSGGIASDVKQKAFARSGFDLAELLICQVASIGE